MSYSQGSLEDDDVSVIWQKAVDDSAGLPVIQEALDTAVLRYGFRIGSAGFLLAQEELGEITTDISVHPIPNTEKWFAGMANMRGNLVPVFNLRMLLGLEGDTSGIDKRKLLVLGSGEMAIGILIDGLPATVSLDQPEDNPPQLDEVITKYLGAAFYDHDQIWMELDSAAFFRHIGEMVSMRQCEH